MARILALDWDHREARFVLASTLRGSLRILAAETVALGDFADRDETETADGDSPDDKPREDKIGEAIRAALRNLKIGRCQVLVGVNRQSVELAHLTLPPATDEELPLLVANQVLHDSQLSDDGAVLDFLPEGGDPQRPRQVTAAILSKEQFERMQQTCAAARLKPRSMLLRSYASASLFSRTTTPPENVCLLVDLVGDEVDLTVTAGGRAVYARTVRLPGDADEENATRLLVGEIKRTMAVSLQDRPDEGAIEGIYIFGGPDDHVELVARIEEELSVPAMVIDPFVGVDMAKCPTPDDSGAFAPLLGMLFDDAQGGAHAMDFLKPRRRPEPRSRRRPLVIVAGVAAALALVAGFHVLDQLSDADAANEALQAKLADLKQLVEKATEKEEVVKAVEQWQASDVNWLDELRDMSLRFPSSRDAIVLRMTLSRARSSGGAVDFSGLVRDPLIVVRMENNMRDEFHEIRSKRVQERQQDKDYTWQFETSMTVLKRPKDKYVSHLAKPTGDANEQRGAQ